MPGSVTGFRLHTGKVEYAPIGAQMSPKDILGQGDILIARGNKREQVGNAAVVSETEIGCAYANLLMKMRCDPGASSPHFLAYWLRSPRIRSIVKARIKGTNPNIQKINQQDIVTLPFPCQIDVPAQQALAPKLAEIEKHCIEAVRIVESRHALIEASRIVRLKDIAGAAALGCRQLGVNKLR